MAVTGEQAEGPAVRERQLEGWAPSSPACGWHSASPPRVVDPSLALGRDRLPQRWSLTQPGNVNLGEVAWWSRARPQHAKERRAHTGTP